MSKEQKLVYLSRDPFAREDRVKRYWGIGTCDWCGRKGKQWEYGVDPDAGRPSFSRGHFCTKGCHDTYHM